MTDRAIDEWTQNAIPPGSGRYYSLLHADAESQHQLRAIATLVSIWSKLCFNSRELTAAQKKLAWWREELNRDTYRHPVTLALQVEFSSNPPMLEAMKMVLDGYGALLDYGSPSSESANALFHSRTGGQVCIALHEFYRNKASLTSDTNSCQILEETGISLSKFRCLRYLRQHMSNGLLCFPLSELEANDIKPDMFSANSSHSDTVRNYVLKLLQELDIKFTQHLQQLPGSSPAAKPIYIYTHLQHKLLSTILQDGGTVLKEETRLTPIKNFFLALLAARRCAKLQAVS
ncbi:hypothetical protein AB833_07330 [Chromatiales bacterium (ex Bugula neritina AB1)]|nr:hypothetical protein AB833_07330 [Chromatiales bacterium (ex Bugula neritina AB1)]